MITRHGLASINSGIGPHCTAPRPSAAPGTRGDDPERLQFGPAVSTTGGRELLFPAVLRAELFAWLALLAFVLCAAAFLIKCGYEVAQRRLNVPKTLHMSLAAGLFFITPALQNLDVAFQGLNTCTPSSTWPW